MYIGVNLVVGELLLDCTQSSGNLILFNVRVHVLDKLTSREAVSLPTILRWLQRLDKQRFENLNSSASAYCDGAL